MPLFHEPTSQELNDHFFGSGAFTFGWFLTDDDELPALVFHLDEYGEVIDSKLITEEDFIDGIKKLAEMDPDDSFDDLIEDMDAGEVDAAIQLAYFGDIIYG